MPLKRAIARVDIKAHVKAVLTMGPMNELMQRIEMAEALLENNFKSSFKTELMEDAKKFAEVLKNTGGEEYSENALNMITLFIEYSFSLNAK
jgi:hypothetical protein